jgi:hypothetical protein
MMLSAPAAAVDRVELQVGRVDGPGWQLREVRASWQRDGQVRVAARAHDPRLPGPLSVELSCAQLQTPVPGCEALQLQAQIEALGRAEARASVFVDAAGGWRLQMAHADVRLQYNSADGRLAAENLRLRISGSATGNATAARVTLGLAADTGLAYVEPWFIDFGAQPLRLDAAIGFDGQHLEIEKLDAEQVAVGAVRLAGTVDTADWTRQHRISVDARIDDAAAAASVYAHPALASTPLQGLGLGGTLDLNATLHDGAVQAIDARLRDLDVDIPRYAVALEALAGTIGWRAAVPAPDSQIRWSAGRIGRLPLGATRLRFQASGTAVALNAPAQIPLLDGSIDIERLALSGLGGDNLQAQFAARLQPIDLRELCKALGWPEFSGTLAGSIPGLQLRDRRLQLDGALSASAFDGEIRIGALSVIDPFGVMPRISADIALRRLDLAAVTGAFDFGRITGRLDGDIDGLRLIGWEPVAMDAHLYTTPDDRSRKRISQRAIDNISAVGGGPTGLLSRGVMRFFDDFAYSRIGWRCVLDNGICRMDGIRSSDKGDGYVLVQGWGLPRIDVVGYSRRVSWPVFMSQLRSIGQSGPARVEGS